jgi:hypothetical protein
MTAFGQAPEKYEGATIEFDPGAPDGNRTALTIIVPEPEQLADAVAALRSAVANNCWFEIPPEMARALLNCIDEIGVTE